MIAPGEYYHIYNRGINKQNIFLNDRDYIRMLFYILFFQSPDTVFNIGKSVQAFEKRRHFNVGVEKIKEIISNRIVELTAFAIMPNHIHLLIQEIKEGGIATYLKRIEGGYTKYFNIKHKRSGYLFQGPYQSVRVRRNEQLLYLSAYIHRNPRELDGWYRNEHRYLWSSYPDFIDKNRWSTLLGDDVILGQFKGKKEYRNFVETSGAKQNFNDDLYIDFNI